MPEDGIPYWDYPDDATSLNFITYCKVSQNSPGSLLLQGEDFALEMKYDSKTLVPGKDYAFVYLPYGNSIDISLEKISGAKRLKLFWFDPRMGKKKFMKKVHARGIYRAKPPTSGYGRDWILILKK